jgi:GMP synthase-like glutamine amidotransferase
MRKHVLILDNAVHRFLFKPSWHWKAHLKGIDARVVNVPSGAAIPSLDGFTHVILTGSEGSILESKPWFEVESKLIRDAVQRGIPILGSCFGHQMLVYALSGPEYLQRSDPPEVGWAKIERIESDPLFEGLPNPWSTFVYHFDEVVDPPDPWRRLGRTEHCDTHVLRYGDRSVWGIQPHPEISSGKSKFFLCITLLFGGKPVRHILQALRHAPPRNDVADTVLQRFLTSDWPAPPTPSPRRGTCASL